MVRALLAAGANPSRRRGEAGGNGEVARRLGSSFEISVIPERKEIFAVLGKLFWCLLLFGGCKEQFFAIIPRVRKR